MITYKVRIPQSLFRSVERDVSQLVGPGIERVLEEGQDVVRRSFTIIPVSAPGNPPAIDTGNLYRNVTTELDADGLHGVLRAATDYAKYLEFGTRHMAARPFMRPALRVLDRRVRQIMREMIRAQGRW